MDWPFYSKGLNNISVMENEIVLVLVAFYMDMFFPLSASTTGI